MADRMELLLIRHSITEGNKKKRYIGRTDEPLCPEGVALLRERTWPLVSKIISSPMKRCVETARIIYPQFAREIEICPDLRECDFGEFENQNYLELAQNQNYRRWVDSNATLPFPGGEAVENFKERTVNAFVSIVDRLRQEGIDRAALVIHGGSIRSILEGLAVPRRGFYEYPVENGEGYWVRITAEDWCDCDKTEGKSGGFVIRRFEKYP